MKFINPYNRPETFIFHTKWRKILQAYPPEVRLEVYEAISDYMTIGETEELKPLATMAFSFIQYDLDRNLEKIDAKKEQCRAAGIASAQRRSLEPSSAPALPSPSSPLPHDQIISQFISQHEIAYQGSLSNLHISPEEFHSLALKVLTQWSAAGWDGSPIPQGRDQYQALDFLKWISTQQRIDKSNETKNNDRLQRRLGTEPPVPGSKEYAEPL